MITIKNEKKMVCFMNHILYGLHLFTQKFEPVVYHNGKVSYNAMLAKKFFLLMLMNYLLCISYSFMSLINMEITQTLFRNSVYKIIYFSIIIVLSLILEYYWFEKDEKEEKYYWKFASKPDREHFKWKLMAWGLFIFSIVYIILLII